MNKIQPVKSGRYLIEGRIAKVNTPTTGKWVGFTFISEIDEKGNEIAQIRKSITKARLLGYIRENTKDCLIAYGRKTGNCGMCGRTLTNPSSIEAGIGPICAEGF